MKDLEKEFADLQLELRELEREVEYQQSHRSLAEPDDLFLPTTEGFVSSTKMEFDRFEGLIRDMKNKFEETLTYFGEDPTDSTAPSVDELFGTFATFLQSFSVSFHQTVHVSMVTLIENSISLYLQDTHQEVIITRKRKEEARKRREELVHCLY